MEFLGYTMCGPQNYMKDVMKKDYREPTCGEDVKEILEKLSLKSTHIGNLVIGLNGFAYGSFERFLIMKKKGVIKPINPFDMYRFPPTSSNEYGWWQYDANLTDDNWYQVSPRYPQPTSPNTLILDKVRKNNKYATLF